MRPLMERLPPPPFTLRLGTAPPLARTLPLGPAAAVAGLGAALLALVFLCAVDRWMELTAVLALATGGLLAPIVSHLAFDLLVLCVAPLA